MNVLHSRSALSSERFFSSLVDDAVTGGRTSDKTRSNIHQSSRLPSWLWTVISFTLGISSDNKSKVKLTVATVINMCTILSGLFFGVCGLYFNVYDTMSTFTKTTVLVCMAKSILGLYWILLGIYSHSLAARLFSNVRMVECIRLHSKTFMKINMVFIIAFLTTLIIGLNIYSNAFLLDHSTSNTTGVYDANCASLGVKVVLCDLYFASKVIYSCLSLCWNLMVAAVCLSVCRTLTIGIRRFMRELSFDSQIFEEYLLMQELPLQQKLLPTVNKINFDDSWMIWDDDIKTLEEDLEGEFCQPSNRESFLKSMRNLRRSCSNKTEHLAHDTMNSSGADYGYRPTINTEEFLDYARPEGVHHIEDIAGHFRSYSGEELPQSGLNFNMNMNGRSKEEEEEEGGAASLEQSQAAFKQSTDKGGEIPIMSNADLLFTYFKLMRRLSSTSRLLQRWMACWITFIVLWCTMLIIYWVSHSATLLGLLEFLLPLITIGLMTSAYAEVNFEGGRLLKCILPTEERMPVIYYFQNCSLELKIFSFVMTYNVLVTVFAGVAITIASRIIIDQFS